MDGVEFGPSFITQATNVSLSVCCGFCADYNLCKSYTYYTMNRTCFLYDNISLLGTKCTPKEDCQSGRICNLKDLLLPCKFEILIYFLTKVFNLPVITTKSTFDTTVTSPKTSFFNKGSWIFLIVFN